MSEPRATSYRPDVDGLRAIAILTVVAYHVGLSGVGGGFVGVDVFFVISGYLISGQLFGEAQRTGRIDLMAFYARRLRRLMPAFMLVMIATLLLGTFLLTPVGGEQQGLAKSAIAALLVNANHYFVLSTGRYFDGPAELQPLLHMWSLSVEEQFYLVWPLLMMALLAVRARGAGYKTIVLSALALVWLLSLWLSIVLTKSHPAVAFYVMPTRAFELATGAMVSMALLSPGRRAPVAAAAATASIGMLAILAAVVFFDSRTIFPGFAALLPVLGAAAVIYGNALAPANPIARLLASRAFVMIGLLSYSWYLWHWPLLAIVRANDLGQKVSSRDIGLALAGLALAWLTYRFVENPVRHGAYWKGLRAPRTVALGLSATAAAVMVFGAFGYVAKNGPFAPGVAELVSASGDIAPSRASCHIENDKPWNGDMPPESCWRGRKGNNGVIVVWGDSHASQWTLFAEKGLGSGWGVLPRSMSSCPPLLLEVDPALNPGVNDSCARFNQKVLAELAELIRTRPVTVLMAARWLGGPPAIREDGGDGPTSSLMPDGQLYRAAIESAPKSFIRLEEIGVRTVVVLPVPEMPYSVPNCLARRSPERCGIKREEYLRQRAEVVSSFGEIAREHPAVRLLDPADYFCDAKNCPASRASAVQYFDDNHPTNTAMRLASQGFDSEWRWLLGKPN